MSERHGLGHLLERESHFVRLPDDAFERMLLRRDRRHRHQQAIGVVVGLAVVVALTAALLALLANRTDVRPGSRPLGAGSVGSLREMWTASVGHAPSPALTDGVVATATSDGTIVAFEEACGSDGSVCGPLWTATVDPIEVTRASDDPTIEWWPAAADQPNAGYRVGSVTAAGGRVYVASGTGSIAAFDARCRTDGGVCRPLWRAHAGRGGEMTLPMVSRGRVYVVDRDGTFAFDDECAGSCPRLLWHTDAVLYLRLQEGRLFATDGPAGRVLELDPVSGATVWSGSIGACCGNTPTPALLGGQIYVNSGTALWGFRASCHDPCKPVSSLGVTDGFSDGPMMAGGVLVLATAESDTDGGVWFVPPACVRPSSDCASGSRVLVDAELTTHQPAVSGSRVFAVSRRGGGFFTFDAACALVDTGCSVVGRNEDVVKPFGPIVAQDVVLVAGAEALDAYAADCSGSCIPLWQDAEIAAYQAPAVDAGWVFQMDVDGRLHAYATTGESIVGATAPSPSGPGVALWFYLGLAAVIAAVYLFRRRRAPF